VKCKSDVDDIFKQVMSRFPIIVALEIVYFLNTKLPDGLYPIPHSDLNFLNNVRLTLAVHGYRHVPMTDLCSGRLAITETPVHFIRTLARGTFHSFEFREKRFNLCTAAMNIDNLSEICDRFVGGTIFE
jgi:hypothetical protein